jgi:hypothetical protein
MQLPNVKGAYVDERKITQYLLNDAHPKGRGKAKFFMRFGFYVLQWEQMVTALLSHTKTHEVAKQQVTDFGVRYVIDGALQTLSGDSPNVRVVWFVDTDAENPRLIIAYPMEATDD